MDYRGVRVPLSEKSPRFHAAGMTSSARFRNNREGGKGEGDKRYFFKLFAAREKPVVHREGKVRSFYRPATSSEEGGEAQRTPFLRGRGTASPDFQGEKNGRAFKTPFRGTLKLLLRMAGLALLLAAVAWSKNRTAAVLQDLAGLKLEKVSVEGNKYLSDEEIAAKASLPLGESMFKLDLNEAGEKVGAMDWVERVFVERRLPRTILISVRERKPLALLDNGPLYGVDREGRVLSPSPALLQEDIPLISGISPRADAAGTTPMPATPKRPV